MVAGNKREINKRWELTVEDARETSKKRTLGTIISAGGVVSLFG